MLDLKARIEIQIDVCFQLAAENKQRAAEWKDSPMIAYGYTNRADVYQFMGANLIDILEAVRPEHHQPTKETTP